MKMTRRIIMTALFVACSLSLLPAQMQTKDRAKRKHRQANYAALAQAPASWRMRTNPFEGNAREATAGGKLYERHCAECHGPKAAGTRRGPSLLREEVQQATPGTLFWVLTNGVVRRGMPVWSKLPDPERWQIVTFLQSMSINRKSTAVSGE